jgi:hypothetical protein
MKYEKLFKKILIESRKQELFKKILQEGEEESVDDILRAYRQSKGSEAYNKSQTYVNGNIHNNEHQIDIINDNKLQNDQIPKPSTKSFKYHLDKYLKTQKN